MPVSPGRLLPLVASIVCAVAFSTPIRAQQLEPGARLRVTVGDARVVGSLHPSPPDSLVLATPEGRTTFSWAQIDRLERSAGRRGHVLRGALIGAGVMTGLGVIALATEGEGDGQSEDWGGVTVAAAIPALAVFGAGVGAVVGLAWRTERWQDIQVRVRVPVGG